jgi:hypothetical protein
MVGVAPSTQAKGKRLGFCSFSFELFLPLLHDLQVPPLVDGSRVVAGSLLYWCFPLTNLLCFFTFFWPKIILVSAGHAMAAVPLLCFFCSVPPEPIFTMVIFQLCHSPSLLYFFISLFSYLLLV